MALLLSLPANATIETAIARSREINLAADPQWHAFLHYTKNSIGSGATSEADSPDFFLAPDGDEDPQAELEASLHAFAAPAETTVRDGHPQCTFPARFAWLVERLAIDEAAIPRQPCPPLEQWLRDLQAVSVTLIFPEAYMNNPSSMFGHTLVRIDMEERGARPELLAYASNFAAETGNDNGVVFAWKGILGFYPGFFTLAPYYEKIVQYGDWEQRDIWEYELNLNRQEIDRMLRHLWELRAVRFDYFFFDENCSYQVLSLLEAARPELRLRQRFSVYAIPSDTVRKVVAEQGLVRQATFRASATTSLEHEARALAPAALDRAIRIARGELAPDAPEVAALPERERAGTLDVAHDYLRHSYLARQVERVPSAERARSILLARSRLAVEGSTAPPLEPPAVRPDQGHRTARASIGGGWRGSRSFVTLEARPAYHDLLDPEGGYTRGAQIDFFRTTARLYVDRGELRLQDLAFVDIFSLAPRDRVFQPWSWRVSTRVISLLTPTRHRGSGVDGLADRYVWRTDGGAGVAYQLIPNIVSYLFAEATADFGSTLDEAHAIGPGGELGVLAGEKEDRWKLKALAEVNQMALGDARTQYRFAVEPRVNLGGPFVLRGAFSYMHDFGESWTEG